MTVAFVAAVIGLLALGVAMRLYRLGVPFDRDSYDEGAYWEALRAMRDGHGLYREVFLAQPPMFLFSIFPTYTLFGASYWSARLGVAVVSCFGLLGAVLLGRSLAGRRGAVAALGLLVASPLYLGQSQTIQAEAPSVAFSVLAVAGAYLWWDATGEGSAGHRWETLWAAVTGISLAMAILCKLSGVASGVAVGLLAVARLVADRRQGRPWRHVRSLLVAGGAFTLASALILGPYVGSPVFDSVYDLHIKAQKAFEVTRRQNWSILRPTLVSLPTAVAAFGLVTSLVRRDWRVLPVAAWMATTTYLLWRQVPLYSHHRVILVPPLVALAVMGLGPPDPSSRGAIASDCPPPADGRDHRLRTVARLAGCSAMALVLVTASLQLRQDWRYFEAGGRRAHGPTADTARRRAADLRQAIGPGAMVVTDVPFIAGLADRHLPPSLVDPSTVRIRSGYLTERQLISATSDPRVHAVLFLSGRLRLLAGFRPWVSRHFRLQRSYGPDQELWTR